MKLLTKPQALRTSAILVAVGLVVGGVGLVRAAVNWHKAGSAQSNAVTTAGDRPEGSLEGNCLCQEGAWRYCERNFGDWGVQHCQAGGQAWGACEESDQVEKGCFAGALWFETRSLLCCQSSETECCQDFHDSDDDGDRQDSVGACETRVCNYERPDAEDVAAAARQPGRFVRR
jgi:hypothetical protein